MYVPKQGSESLAGNSVFDDERASGMDTNGVYLSAEYGQDAKFASG